MSGQRPLEWVSSLIARFEDQLPVKNSPLNSQARLLIEQSKSCLVSVSKNRFTLVISGLIKTLQAVNGMRTCSELDLFESQCIILDTLEQCLASQPKETGRLDEAANVKLILTEICQFFQQPSDTPQQIQLKEHASKVLYGLSISNLNAVFAKISAKLKSLSAEIGGPDGSGGDMSDLELIQHIHMDLPSLTRLLQEIAQHKPFRKDNSGVLITSLEKAIWNWIDSYPEHFQNLGRGHHDSLIECCDKLFEQLDAHVSESNKRKMLVWPLQMMLLILCPKVLEEIANAHSGAPCSPRHQRKKAYYETIRKVLCGSVSHNHTANKSGLLMAACITGVKLMKAATYINNQDSANVFFNLVATIIDNVKLHLFNLSKPLFRTWMSNTELEVLIDAFVACYRLQKYNTDTFKVCFNPNAIPAYQLVLVMGVYRIAVQPRLPWWPDLLVVYEKALELRYMFSETLNRVTQNSLTALALSQAAHTQLGITRSLPKVSQLRGMITLRQDRSGTAGSDEITAAKQILFWLIRLICTDPVLFLNREKQLDEGAESQNITLDLLNGLVSLVSHATTLPEISQEAMEALLCLHQPENIRLWNPEAPLMEMQNFWYTSSQLLFYICQNLLHHQLLNYPEVLRWLRELLMCRNAYFFRHRETCKFGSQEQLCRQAYIKLETVAFLYLWSLEVDAVLTAISLFRILCEEAEIRSSGDELPYDYFVHAELAAASSNVQPVGRAVLQKSVMAHLRRIKKPTAGCTQAWEDTYHYWEAATKYLKSYPKSKTDESGQMTHNLHRTLALRRASKSKPEHEIEDIVNEWANMTGFLCALGGICMAYYPASPRPSLCGSSLSIESRRTYSTTVISQQESTQYCPVTQFLSQLLSLLHNQPEKIGVQVQRNIKELLSNELNPALYGALFDRIKLYADKFFDSCGQVMLSDGNTEFLEHIVYIMKNILTDGHGSLGCSMDSASSRECLFYGVTTIEQTMISIVK